MFWMKCHSLSLEKHNKSISKWHFLTLLNWWNMQESTLSHNVAIHPSMRALYEKCPMLAVVMMYVVFSYKERSFLTQNPKLNSRPLTQTMIQCLDAGVQHNTECSEQWRAVKLCCKKFAAGGFIRPREWLPVHSWDRHLLRTRRTVLSEVER